MGLQELTKRIETLENQLKAKDEEIAELRDAPLSEYSVYLVKAIDKVLPVLGWAMGNLPPEANVGCPCDDLDAFLDLLDKVVAIDKRYRAVLIDWKMRSGEYRSVNTDHAKKKSRAPRAKPANRVQLTKMAADFDKEFGEGALQARVRSLTTNK